MIKIHKDITKPPESLIPAYEELFPDRTIPIQATTTHRYRQEIIDKGAVPKIQKYKDRYKLDDIKQKLQEIYHKKCAYCEQHVEESHVEHYRPCALYFWLIYSWDNLLLACPTCNKKKLDHFEIHESKAHFDNSEDNLKKINELSAEYDQQEQPLLINPETTDPKGYIEFTKHGEISSTQENFHHTISICGLDRRNLRDCRRKILNDFRNKVASILMEYQEEEHNTALKVLVRSFVLDANNDDNEFIALRKYCIDNGWLEEFIKEERNCS